MRAKFLTSTFVIFLSAANAQTSTAIKMEQPAELKIERSYIPSGKLTFAIYARQIDDALSKSNQGVAIINPDMEVKYGSQLTLGLDFAAILGTGNASNFWNDDGKAPNSVVLTKAFAKYNFHENVFLRIGALETTINPVYSIMSNITFIAAQQEWQIGAKNSNISLAAQQAIPSSGSVSRRIYEDSSQAYFLSQSVSAKLKDEELGSELKAAATRFQFENLSSNVATDSALLGNSLGSFEGVGKAYRFKFGFMGTEVAAHVSQEVGSFDFNLRGSKIVNDQGPKGTNEGQQYGFLVKYNLGNVVLKSGYTKFDYGADVTPATYTLVTSRFHNREGHRITMDVELKKEKLALKTFYINMKEIEDNPYLADREIYNVLLEAKYDIF